MRKTIITLFLFPVLLFAGERKKEVALYRDGTQEQSFIFCGPNIWKTLQEKRIRLFTTDLKKTKDYNELTYVVISNKLACPPKELLKKFPQKKLLLFMWEPTDSFADFHRVYTWDDDLVDNKKFFKLYYPVLKPMIEKLPEFEEKKLVTVISSNPNLEQFYARESIAKFFEDKDISDNLMNYRFNVCYENTQDRKGYITEKIFNSFAAGSVPIYWGASNVTDYIPKNCFIDRRDFKDFSAVYDYIRTMDQTTYETYLKNIHAYLESDKAKLFSQELFEVIFLEAIRFP